MNEIISAVQEGLRLIEQVFPLPAIVAGVVAVVALIWYSLRKK